MLYDRVLAIRDFTDGTSSTLIVSEDSGFADMQWINARNLFDQAYAINERPTPQRPLENEIRSRHPGGANGLFVDGSVRFLRRRDGPGRPGRDLYPRRRRDGSRRELVTIDLSSTMNEAAMRLTSRWFPIRAAFAAMALVAFQVGTARAWTMGFEEFTVDGAPHVLGAREPLLRLRQPAVAGERNTRGPSVRRRRRHVLQQPRGLHGGVGSLERLGRLERVELHGHNDARLRQPVQRRSPAAACSARPITRWATSPTSPTRIFAGWTSPPR